MTENLNVDTPEAEGAGGSQPPVSADKGQSIEGQPQGSQELLEIRKSVEQLGRELKGLQSRQDRDKNETQRFMDEVKAQMANGLSIDEAERAVTERRKASEKDELLYRIAQKLEVLDKSSPSAGSGVSVTSEAAKVFAKAGVNANDPNFATLAAQYSDPIELAMAVAEKKSSLANKPVPSAADASVAVGNTSVPKADLRAEFEKASAGVRGQALIELKMQYRKKGLDIY